MEQIKICTTGLQMLTHLRTFLRQARHVCLGSFNFDTSLDLWIDLPKGSDIIVGVPREGDRGEHLLRHLSWFKGRRPDLNIFVRPDFHAKYALFRFPKTLWVMIGSANCTPSPACEVVMFAQSESVYKLLGNRHQAWKLHAQEIQPSSVRRLSRDELRALHSQVVGET